ncbi:MAG: serine/threonine-protein kinase [Pirellulales bacterium]
MMSKEKNLPASGTDSPDVGSDTLDELLREMFLRKEMALLAALSDIDLEQLSEAGEIPSAAGTTIPAARRMELPTLNESAETIADPGSVFYGEGAKEDFHSTIGNVDNFEKQGSVTFRGEYRKATELGRGGQGVVYRIEGEDEFSAAFALKVFLPRAYENLADFSADMTRMQRVASLIHHQPHDDLVDIGWFGQRDGVYTMLMQYIDGFDLRHLLQPELMQHLKQCVDGDRWRTINNVVYSVNGSRQLALQPAIAVYIIERVLRGVEALHSRGIVHGDIKPSNIMLNASGSVKIIDIGSAFEITSPPKDHYVTPAYAAPEFLETGAMSKQSDLASVGYVLIELLSGKSITDEVRDPDESTRTIGGPRRMELFEAKNSLPDRLTNILPWNILESNHLVELCRRLIDPDLNQRFPSAAESIVDRKGTYEFNKDLILSNLGVCNFQEVSQWLADVKHATRWARGIPSPPR